MTDADLLEEGRAALRRGDGAGARLIFERNVDEDTSGAVIEGLANAAYLELDYAPAIDGLERAYAIYRDTGDHVGAARTARSVAYLHGTIVGDPAVMRGWLARAETLLGDLDSREAVGSRSASACSKATAPGRTNSSEAHSR